MRLDIMFCVSVDGLMSSHVPCSAKSCYGCWLESVHVPYFPRRLSICRPGFPLS